MKPPRFALLAAGIGVAGAGGLAFDLGADWRLALAIGAGGVALMSAEFLAIGRGREKEDTELGRDLAREAKSLDAPDIDEAWVHQEFGSKRRE